MDILLIIILSVLTFITRVINLLKTPIFTDEAIYIRWAQIGLADPAHRYISLTDGKQPLLTWLMYPFLLIFSDPLFAGRIVSVLSGILAVIGIYLLAKILFNRKTAVAASLLYIFSPFTLVYDRLALMDSLLAAIAVWSLYLQVLLVKYLRLDIALLLGITVGLGLMTKSSAMFFLYLLPAGLLLFNFKLKDSGKILLKWILLSFLSIIIAQVMFNSLRLSPLFYIIEQKNYSFILTFPEFIQNPWRLFQPNLYGLMTFLRDYLTVPVIMLVTVNLFVTVFRKNFKVLLLFIWFAVPFLALAAFGKILFPRFILFMCLPLLLIAADLLADLFNFARTKMKFIYIGLILILINPFYNSINLISDPVHADIPVIDRNQLFDDWPSGYGVREVVAFLELEAEDKKIVVGTEGTFGLNPAVYEIYLKKNENVIIRGYWPVNNVPQELLDFAEIYPTYLVFKDKQLIPDNWPLKLIAKYRRGLGNTYLYFFQVIPENGSI